MLSVFFEQSAAVKEILKEQESRKGLIAAICAGTVPSPPGGVAFLQKLREGVVGTCKTLFQVLLPRPETRRVCGAVFSVWVV